MKHFAMPIFSLFISSQVFAFDYCMERQILEAKIAHAKHFQKNVSQVTNQEFKGGPWTRMDGNNHGSDSVTVGHWELDGEQYVSSEYVVYAHQIEKSDDCHITNITRN